MNRPLQTQYPFAGSRHALLLAKLSGAVVCLGVLVSVCAAPAICNALQIDRVSRNVSAAKDVSNERLAECFADLESDSYAARERACRTLRKAGLKAVPGLAQRVLYGKPESSFRSGLMLTEIALNSNEADMTRVGRVINLLAQNGSEHLADTAIDIQNLWKQQQVANNIVKLEDAGFVVVASSRMMIWEEGQNAIGTEPADDVEAEGPKASSKKLASKELQQRINAIVEVSDEESLQQFSSEVLKAAKTEAPAQTLHGDDPFNEIESLLEGSVLSNHFAVSINRNTRLDESTFDTMLLLPINAVEITGRNLDSGTLGSFQKMPYLHSVTLAECQYDLKEMFAWVARMPNTTITSTGNKAFLGVQTQVAAFNGEAYECLIEEVVKDTAAEIAGLKVGDIIELVDGTKIRGHNELVLAIGTFKPGDTAKLSIRRDDQLLEKEVRFKERPEGQ